MAIQTSGIQFVAKDLGSFLGALNSAARGVSGFVKAAGDSAGKLNILSGHLKNFGQDLAYVARHLLLDAVRAVGDAVSSFIRSGLEQVTMYDRLQGSLLALTARELLATGGVKTFAEGMDSARPIVAGLLKWVEQLALVSTFESEDVRNVLQYAQSVGIATKDAQAMTFALTSWGTVTRKQPHELLAVSNALTDMFTKGKIQSEEMRQLTRNNIPAWRYMADAIGVPIDKLREMVSDGLVPADVGIRAIVEGLAKDFGPAMKDFTFSIAGITSSIKDISKINLRELFMPVVQAVLPAMERMVAILIQPEVRQRIQLWGYELGVATKHAVEFAEAMIASGHPIEFIALKIDESLPGFFSFTQQLEKLGETFMEIARKAFNWGDGIGKGIADGLLNAASKVASAVQSILDAINKLMGAGKPPEGPTGTDIGRLEGGFPGGSPFPQPGGAQLPPGNLGIDQNIMAPMGEALDELNSKAAEAKKHWADLAGAFDKAKKAASDVAAVFEPLSPLMQGIGIALATVVSSGLLGVAAAAFRALTPFGLLITISTLLVKAWQDNFGGIQDIVKNAFGGIDLSVAGLQSTFDTLVTKVNSEVLPALSSGFKSAMDDASQGAKIAGDAIQKAWTGTILPAIQTVAAFFMDRVIPVLATIYQGVVPLLNASISTAASAFTNVLMPAVRLIWDVFTRLLWPIIEVVAGAFTSLLSPALVAAAGVLSNTVFPAVKTLFDFASNYVVPLLEALGRIVGQVLRLAWEALAAVWNSVVIPGLKILWDNIKPVLDILAGPGGLEAGIDRVSRGFDILVGWISDTVGGLEGIQGAVHDAIGWLNDLADTLSNIHVPSDFIMHSPPPLARSLMSVAEAAKGLLDVARLWPAAFSQMAGVTGELWTKLQGLQKKAEELAESLTQGILSSKIGGFGQMRDNFRDIRSLFSDSKKLFEDAAEKNAEAFALEEKAAQLRLENKLAEADDAVNRAAVIRAQANEDEARAKTIDSITKRSEAELERARAEFIELSKIDPQNATELYQLRSKQIKDLAAIDMELSMSKDEKERQSLYAERDFLLQQQQVEMELFNHQADERNKRMKADIQEIAQAFSDAWNNLDLQGDFVGAVSQLYDLVVALSGLQLPTWLTPGSPTPLENALMGIGKAMHKLWSAEFPAFRSQFERMQGVASAGQIVNQYMGKGRGDYTYAPQYNLGVNTNQSPQVVFQSYEMMRSLYG